MSYLPPRLGPPGPLQPTRFSHPFSRITLDRVLPEVLSGKPLSDPLRASFPQDEPALRVGEDKYQAQG